MASKFEEIHSELEEMKLFQNFLEEKLNSVQNYNELIEHQNFLFPWIDRSIFILLEDMYLYYLMHSEKLLMLFEKNIFKNKTPKQNSDRSKKQAHFNNIFINYVSYLSKLTAIDRQNMQKFITQNGFNGYLIFCSNEEPIIMTIERFRENAQIELLEILLLEQKKLLSQCSCKNEAKAIFFRPPAPTLNCKKKEFDNTRLTQYWQNAGNQDTFKDLQEIIKQFEQQTYTQNLDILSASYSLYTNKGIFSLIEQLYCLYLFLMHQNFNDLVSEWNENLAFPKKNYETLKRLIKRRLQFLEWPQITRIVQFVQRHGMDGRMRFKAKGAGTNERFFCVEKMKGYPKVKFEWDSSLWFDYLKEMKVEDIKSEKMEDEVSSSRKMSKKQSEKVNEGEIFFKVSQSEIYSQLIKFMALKSKTNCVPFLCLIANYFQLKVFMFTLNNFQIERLVQDLARINNNITDLIIYYELQQDRSFTLRLYWTDLEDSIIKAIDDMNENEVQLLIRYKGIQNVISRLHFYALKVPERLKID